MKRLTIATGLCVMFTLLSVFSAKADGWHDRDHGRDRREWRERERRSERREWREHERHERWHAYDRCRPRVYFRW